MKKLGITFLMMMLLASMASAAETVAIGAKAPSFNLVNAVDGKAIAFKPEANALSVVVFTCNQCPYAKAFEPRLIDIAKQYQGKNVKFYLIDPNDDTKYAEETMENMKARAVEKGYPFPYLKDGDSTIAKAYGARVTPHVFVVDKGGVVRYRGYVDDTAKPAERKVTGLTDALDSLLAGQQVATPVTREFGCSIKWKT